VRKRAGWLATIFRPLVFALLTLAVAGTAVAAPVERVVRTPRKAWERTYDAALERLTLVNAPRVVAIEMRVVDSEPTGLPDVNRLIEQLTGQSFQGTRQRWPKKILDQGQVQRGVSFVLTDGRKGMYAEVWRRQPDGRLGIAGYMAIASEYDEKHIADFKIVRGLANQLSRGAVLNASLRPMIAVEPETVIAALPPVTGAGAAVVELPVMAPVATADLALPVLTVPAPVTSPVIVATPAPVLTAALDSVVAPPVIATPVSAPTLPQAVPAVPVVVATASSYPFAATLGAGVPMGQVASILYAPLESSEVFVLFKDGSFHEDLPVALEQWNMAASRSDDPSSWGKWKPSKDAGDFEMQYASDDIVTISATKIKPAKSGMVIAGSYMKSSADENSSDEIRFSGNRFDISKNGQNLGGTYRVDGYSVILTHDDGKVEHLPFFVVPPQDDGDDPAIWLGDSLLDRVE
jgi:hypothetical protein